MSTIKIKKTKGDLFYFKRKYSVALIFVKNYLQRSKTGLKFKFMFKTIILQISTISNGRKEGRTDGP